MSIIELLVIVILVLLLVGLLPTWPYSAGFTYTPSFLMLLLIVVLIVLLLMGRL